MAKTKKIQLQPGEPEGELYGISTSLQAHKFIYFLNKQLFFDFNRIPDLSTFCNRSEKMEEYTTYEHTDEELRADFYLIVNFNGNGYLFAAQKQFQFILLIQTEAHKSHIDPVVQKIKKIEGVQLVYKLQPQTIKELDYFIDDFEMFQSEIKKKSQ